MGTAMSFEQLMAEMAKARQLMQETFEEAPPCQEKDMLGKILQNLTSTQGEIEKAYPKAVAEIRASLEKTQSGIEQARQAHANAATQLDDALAQAQNVHPAPPVTPSEHLPDLELGQLLRQELLVKVTPQEAPRPRPQAARDIWEDWS